jgi:DNA primase
MIDQASIDKIFETADIVEVISDYVQLKKAGSNYKGLSPFTNEKTPSFMVSPSKGIFKDFSSGKGGNVVGFLMEIEKFSYPDALRFLAKKYNIPLFERELTVDDKIHETERESLLVVSSFAQKYFSNNLTGSAEGKAIGFRYLMERGFREDIISRFQLGYSFTDKDAFTLEAKKQGYKLEYLIKSGLTIEKNGSHFDRFSGRIIFPIHGISGSVIGFGGRTLRTDKETAKYLNSPESEIFYKGKILYGLFFAKKSIVSNDKCFLTEGYTDVISLHQSGIENVVASSGTALTLEQIRLVKRFTQNITIIYDGDEAGIKASFRGIDLVLEEGMNVRVILLPDGEDPDSFSRKHNSSELKEYISRNETDFITFKSRILLKGTANDPVKKAGLITDIVRSVSVIPSAITRAVYLKECSGLLDVEENILINEVNKIRRKSEDVRWQVKTPEHAVLDAPAQPQIPSFVDKVYSENEERDIIYFLLRFSNNVLSLPGEGNAEISVAEYIIREIRNDNLEFKNLIYRKVFETFSRKIDNGEAVEDKAFIYHEDKHISELAVEMFTSRYEISKVWKRKDTYIELPGENLGTEVPKAILAYKNKIIVKAIQELHERIGNCDQQKEVEQINDLQKQVISLDQIKSMISKDLGERTIISFAAPK